MKHLRIEQFKRIYCI